MERAGNAVAVASIRVDPRDALWAADVIAACTADLGVPVATMRSALAGAAPAVAERFEFAAEQALLRPSPWQGTLFSKVVTRSGVGLVSRDLASYDPTVDLLKAAMQIGDLLDADRYLADDPTIATHLPGIWLGLGTPDRKVAGLGCSSIGGIDWDRSSRWDRMFKVWIIESRSTKRARKIVGQAIAATGEHARLAIAEGPLASVFVARSATVDVAPDETDDSLLRFEQPCIGVMRSILGFSRA